MQRRFAFAPISDPKELKNVNTTKKPRHARLIVSHIFLFTKGLQDCLILQENSEVHQGYDLVLIRNKKKNAPPQILQATVIRAWVCFF
mmetsp:Transcript_43835/g.105754  ORF Transcript_43835/g.105754 Transcript_43835/m.105754 type:complete len:88 (-) Transcript_43835:1912-2175(-)